MRRGGGTRLGALCASALEACWLLALIVAPLFFNLLSYRIFEPDKTVLVRVLALVALLAGVIWLVETVASRDEGRISGSVWQAVSRPLQRGDVAVLFLVLLSLISLGLSTVLSVAPRVSALGSHTRLQGLYTTASYAVLFAAVVVRLRSRTQLDRFLTAVLLVSLPVSLYGILQHFGGDTIAWMESATFRVRSSMGNAVFVAAYVILCVPLCAYRILISWRAVLLSETGSTAVVLVVGSIASFAVQIAAWLAGPTAGTVSALVVVATWFVLARLADKRPTPYLHVALYTVLFSAQSMCLFFSQSRGPILAFVVGLVFLVLLWLLSQRAFRKALVAIFASTLVVAGLLFVNLHGPTARWVQRLPVVGPLANIFQTSAGSGKVRILVWDGVLDVVRANPWRAMIGHGPETLKLTYPAQYRPELAHIGGRRSMPDRSHNETLDTLYAKGAVGILLYLCLFSCIIAIGLRRMGLYQSRRLGAVFWSLVTVGAATSAIAFRLWHGTWVFIGVSLPTGMLAGVAGYLSMLALLGNRQGNGFATNEIDRQERPLVAVLLAALIAHFFEVQLGIAVVATRVYFWLYLGLLLATGSSLFANARDREVSSDRSGATDGQSESDSSPLEVRGAFAAASLIAGVILLTLVYNFQLTLERLTSVSTGVLWIGGWTWVFAGSLTVIRFSPAHSSMRELVGRTFVYVGLSIVPLSTYLLLRASLSELSAGPAVPFVLYVTLLILLVILLAVILADRRVSRQITRWRMLPIYGVLAFTLLFVAWRVNVEPVRADIEYRRALVPGRPVEETLESISRASRLAPHDDFYHLERGRVLVEMARRAQTPALRTARLHQAEQSLLSARRISPLDPDHAANLARLYRFWGESTDPGGNRRERLDAAARYYRDAIDLSPNMAQIRDELAETFLAKGDTVRAVDQLERSLQLDDDYDRTHFLLGLVYEGQGRYTDAVRSYRRAIEINPRSVAAQYLGRLQSSGVVR